MPKWFKFETGEQEALKAILEDDAQMSESYAEYVETGESACAMAEDGVQEDQLLEAIVRKSFAERILEKLEHEGREVNND